MLSEKGEISMNKEELLENTSIFNDKDIFEKLDKNKELRDWFLVELNAYLQRSESVVANLKDKKELRCYKNAVTSLEVENQKQKEVIDKIYELIKQHIRKDEFLELNEWQTRDLLDLLKEVSK